jgi:hypothetical protein
MPKVIPGQPLRIAARDYNAMLEAAQAYRNGLLDQGLGDALPGNRAGIVIVRNEAGGDQKQFAVLGIGGVLITPQENEPEFRSRWAISGGTPSDSDAPAFVILQEPIASGRMGKALIYGVSPVKLIRKDDDTSPVAGAEGETGHLISGKLGSQVLWEEDYSGEEEHWALVRFPVICGKKKTLNVVTNAACDQQTGEIVVTTESIEYLSSKWKDD